MKFYILLAFALCLLSCSSKRSVVQSSTATHVAGSSVDSASHVAEADSMHATSSAEVQKDSENIQESETLRITDTVTIWEHADGTTDKKSTHTEERTVSRNTEKNSEATKSKTDTNSTNIKTSDTASNFQKVDSLSVRSEDKVIEKKSSGGFWTGFKIATALFVLVAFLLVFMYLKK